MTNTTREQLPLMLDQQKLVEENRLLRDQLDHAQSLITTPVKDYVKLELRLQEMAEEVRALEKELIQVYRDKAELNRKVSDLLSRPTIKTDNPPTPCKKEIYEKGKFVTWIIGANSATIEEYVRFIAKITETETDWHYFGGRAQVLTLGDPAIVRQVLAENWLQHYVGEET